ncbi:MAG: hypothetical protein C6W55_01360 [Thermobacillus sp.]|nr:MAG: hypothetical protein C6W55_01360 [Thermobacillus sp.]
MDGINEQQQEFDPRVAPLVVHQFMKKNIMIIVCVKWHVRQYNARPHPSVEERGRHVRRQVHGDFAFDAQLPFAYFQRIEHFSLAGRPAGAHDAQMQFAILDND